ncbi:Arc family DNA-binding protein [Brucella anthropi]|uniref:Arc family DNA-binding protein n=1 Tax=Brucella anthropi TaxID=529 RepID=UPI0034E55E75
MSHICLTLGLTAMHHAVINVGHKGEKRMSRDDLHFRLRIPEGIKTWIKEKAGENRRSMTSEIIFILETAMKKEKGEATA